MDKLGKARRASRVCTGDIIVASECAEKDKYAFIGEWYDTQASLIRRYSVCFYPVDDTLEMFDLRTRKTFVSRGKVIGITLSSFYIGCNILIFGRLIKIVDFANEFTRRNLHRDLQVAFVLIKPLPTNIAGKVVRHFNENGLRTSKMKKCQVAAYDVQFLYRTQITNSSYQFLLEHLTNQCIFGMELVGKDAVERCIELIGDQDPIKAAPGTIRALYGKDPVRNCVDCSGTAQNAKEDIDYFFRAQLRLTATLSNCTLCIVKPHALREGKLGTALELIHDGGFNVTALNMFQVENVNAAEFYEVYKGIAPEFQGMVEELASGPCIAMELQAQNQSLNTAVEFRKLVGPVDPEIARLIRPHTLRAKLGNTKVQNAIHCSDLPEDGLLEVEYFFKILEF